MANERRFVSEYYDHPVDVEYHATGAAGGKLIWFITQDQLSPPIPFDEHVASGHESLRKITEARVSNLIGGLSLNTGDIVLDLGSGIGGASRSPEVAGTHVIGINTSTNQLVSSKGLSEHYVNHDHRSLTNSDMSELPFRSSSVDAVYSVNAIYHVGDFEKVLTEASRTLSIGGKLAVDDWFLTDNLTEDTQRTLRYNWSSPNGFHVYRNFVEFANSIGFSVIYERDFTEEAGSFYSDEALGTLYREEIDERVRAGFEKLWPDQSQWSEPSSKQLLEDMLKMGEFYRTRRAEYRQVIFQKTL